MWNTLISIETSDLSPWVRLHAETTPEVAQQVALALSSGLPSHVVRAFKAEHNTKFDRIELAPAIAADPRICEAEVDQVLAILTSRVSGTPDNGELAWAISRTVACIIHVRNQRDATVERLNEFYQRDMDEMVKKRRELRAKIAEADSQLQVIDQNSG